MSWTDEKEALGRRIMRGLYERGLFRTWRRDRPQGWELVSGLWSPFYVQLRPICSFPDLMRDVGAALAQAVQEEVPGATHVVGIAMAGIPIALATSLASGLPCAYTRKLEGVRSMVDIESALATYGEHSLLEGEVSAGDRLVFVDDLVTGMDSKLVAIEQVRHHLTRRHIEGVALEDVLVILDREQGAAERAAEACVRLHSLIPLRSRGIEWLSDDLQPV
jgi:orotate phosphoribosyltransferase